MRPVRSMPESLLLGKKVELLREACSPLIADASEETVQDTHVRPSAWDFAGATWISMLQLRNGKQNRVDMIFLAAEHWRSGDWIALDTEDSVCRMHWQQPAFLLRRSARGACFDAVEAAWESLLTLGARPSRSCI
jgi:hypothetical protein